MRPIDAAWSCVVDDTPQIWSSIIPWLATAIDLAGIDPSRLYVHHVCALKPDVEVLCRRLKVNTRAIEPFDRRFPHTNKIRQCGMAYGDAGRVVLTDVDVAFAWPLPLHVVHTPVAGKLVDLPNPPLDVLRSVFSAAGLPEPGRCTNAYLDSQNALVEFETFPGNCNGGLLVIAREHLAPLGQAWGRWARWLIGRIDLLSQWAVHVDQVSFCLAINQLGMEVGQLDNAWNFPLGVQVAAGGIAPFLLHHHAALENARFLEPVSSPLTRESIVRVNGAIASFHRRQTTGR